ncbi:MAG: gluconate:H+ symporter, GntP family [Petrotoga sp.]|nr:gluconate:H+ symporter, GntP family [Petrotoga sp.]
MGIWLIVLLVLSVIFIIFATARLTLHPFLVLLFTAVLFGIFSGMSLTEIVDSITGGFGGTLGSIGIVIAAGTIIGTFLEKSGGAFKMAEATLKLTGEKRVPLAMAIIGYIVSIPVFCDSGFVILSPLNRAVTKRACCWYLRCRFGDGYIDWVDSFCSRYAHRCTIRQYHGQKNIY